MMVVIVAVAVESIALDLEMSALLNSLLVHRKHLAAEVVVAVLALVANKLNL